ncbi:hypothetical protein TGARI_358680 [Toxoplasma gondii ARI]|uniref:Uncharacterized protein n=1 Tax=Toxoplasma gondii ARI TaxID=1074872 RepID=A0A139Y0V3_TOXGO|nr:hypothetical protein TGARI_358680 [Toxoplasma gondii ARI]
MASLENAGGKHETRQSAPPVALSPIGSEESPAARWASSRPFGKAAELRRKAPEPLSSAQLTAPGQSTPYAMSEAGGRPEIASKFFSLNAWRAASGIRVVPLWEHSGEPRPKAEDGRDDRRDGGCAGHDEHGERESGEDESHGDRYGGSDRVEDGGGGRAESDKAGRRGRGRGRLFSAQLDAEGTFGGSTAEQKVWSTEEPAAFASHAARRREDRRLDAEERTADETNGDPCSAEAGPSRPAPPGGADTPFPIRTRHRDAGSSNLQPV